MILASLVENLTTLLGASLPLPSEVGKAVRIQVINKTE